MAAPTPASALSIDRLTLSLPGLSPAQGREVAGLVAAGLAAAGTLPQSGMIPRLSVTLRAGEQATPESLARRIVAETLQALARTP
jgi:hypothetical protein